MSVVVLTSAKQAQHRFVRLSLIRVFGQNIGCPIEHEEEHKYFLQPLQGRKDLI